ncbi:MAG: HAD-IA family hydrolase [Candidatus Aenigmarchaeota archaeon]|nr:HAD-IA family hydrolase [Candidatus Aenigmarchaeota archaeon]
MTKTGAVIFDVDGVLLDSFDSNFMFCRDFLKSEGFRLTKKEYAQLFYRSLWDVISITTGIADETEIRRLWNSAKKFDRDGKRPILAKDAVKTLKLLSEHYRLAIVTSRVKVYLYEPPMDSVKTYFRTAVAYEDTTRHKPHPEPLLLAANRLKIKPSGTVYIGDAASDMEAAKAAGMKFILS